MIGEDRTQWIAQRPWWPDWKLRLFRNIPSIVRIPGRLHRIRGQGGLALSLRGSIYHYDFVYHDEQHRKENAPIRDHIAREERQSSLFPSRRGLAGHTSDPGR